jgi:hypothetical protein
VGHEGVTYGGSDHVRCGAARPHCLQRRHGHAPHRAPERLAALGVPADAPDAPDAHVGAPDADTDLGAPYLAAAVLRPARLVDADPYPHADSDADPDADSHSDAHADAHADPDADSHADPDPDRDLIGS